MKRIAIFGTLCLIVCTAANAQVLPQKSGKILSWDDFTVREDAEEKSSALIIHWDLKKQQAWSGPVRILYNLYSVEARSDLSWVRSDCRNAEELSRNQTILEMAESFADAANDAILFSSDNQNSVFQKYYQQYSDAVQSYLAGGEAVYPYDGKQWDPASTTWARPRNGFFWGVGLMESILLGSAADLIGPATAFQVNVGLFKGRFACMVDAAAGRSKGLVRYTQWQGSMSNSDVPYYNFSAKGAFLIPRFGSLQVSPFIGAGYTYRSLMDIYKETTVKIQGPTISEGICLDWFFRPTVNLRGSFHHYSETGLELKLYSDQIWMASRKMFIPSVQVMLGITLPYGSVSRQ